jgi:hypothetical protein
MDDWDVGRWLYLLDGEEALASRHECDDVKIILLRKGACSDSADLVLRFLQPVFTLDDLTDAQQMKRTNRSTFQAPNLEELSSVAPGWLVKICSCSSRYFVKGLRVVLLLLHAYHH